MARERFLVITADDFGLHEAVNEAVERASRAGVLTAASLMMGEAGTDDAVERARRLPELRIGLHLVLADGHSVLPAGEIRSLVDENRRFGNELPLEGARYFLLPGVRRQLEAEIRAQFRAFAATGLGLDHVNAHKHFHLHPTLLTLILKVGRDFGMRAMRVPAEPGRVRADGSVIDGVARCSLAPWLALMKYRLRRAGIAHNDSLLGIADSGRLGEHRLLALLERLPPGITEIYLHPATRAGEEIAVSMQAYRHTEELAALLSPRVRAAISMMGVRRGGYADLRALQ